MARYYISLLLTGLLSPCTAQQQALLSNAGGYFQTAVFNVAWSLGEPVTETFSTETYTFTQGFQQSQLDPVGVIEPKVPLKVGIEVFPNPTHGLVFIKLNQDLFCFAHTPDRYSLYNIHGKQVAQGRIQEDQFIVDLNPYSGAVYYLRLFNSESNTQSTVIIQKIN